MDGLANTWLFDARMEEHSDDEEQPVNNEMKDCTLDNSIEPSVVPGCYATLAYDELGRDSFSEQGVRLKYVVFQKRENEFLGATVSVSGRSILVARIVNGGLAQKTNLLHEGDELLAVNGTELLGKDLNTATEILGSLHGQVVLLVAPAAEPISKQTPGGIIHLRALFSYEPEDDRQLACQELGLPFSKGDILHITDRRDPDWWQAYRNDEETGITGAVGTLAGLIPSPTFQRRRSILRLRSLFNTNPKEIDWEEEPSDCETSAPRQVTGKTPKRFLGIQLPFINGKSGKSQANTPIAAKSATEFSDLDESDSPDSSALLVNSALISSIYADRMSDNRLGRNISPSESAIEEWTTAGPVWGQHGFEIDLHHRSRGAVRRRRSGKGSFPCLKNLRGEKRSYGVLDRFPSVYPGPDPTFGNAADPVAWLEKEVANGHLPHPSLWTYEPMAQYFPQPLRRRPLVFVGPAHVGRHQLMQRLIQSDRNRFCSVPIVTTNTKMKSDDSVTYEYVTEEAFEADRKRGEFIECGVFNRARYATSLSSVRKLVEAGKVCCITVRPDSLRRLRSSGLMPYVIFISPPDRVDELRRIQKLLGLKANCSDFELISCIEASRKMEVRFGHWFDVAIVPEAMDMTVAELEVMATRLEREPSWIPRYWVTG